jgi:2-iminobutanoate/2-iminopropanoate deaminase
MLFIGTPAAQTNRSREREARFNEGRDAAVRYRPNHSGGAPHYRRASFEQGKHDMKRLRVEPISSYLERRRKGPIYPVTIANGFVYLSGLPPFDPETGDVRAVDFERQVELVLAQMKHCLEAAGSSLGNVLKCNVYCTPDPTHFARFNAVYERFFPSESPARIFLHVPSWPGPFDVEVDCVAVVDTA